MNKTFSTFAKLALSLAAVAFLVSSCSKEATTLPIGAKSVQDVRQQQQIRDMVDRLPSVGIYNRTMDKILVFTRNTDGTRGFSFTTTDPGSINFASSNGGQWVWSEQGGMAVITEPGAGMGGGGGVVSAGNSTLDIDLAVCFAASDSSVAGGGLFGPDMGEVAGVIGISGDFDALANGDFDEGNEDAVWDFFHGFAYYFVYADELGNESYDVLNWIDDLDQDEEDLQDFSFAFVVSLQGEGGIYLSKDGDISVDGGTMSFNGQYYAVEGIGFFDDDNDDGNDSFSVVSGFGAMGCDN